MENDALIRQDLAKIKRALWIDNDNGFWYMSIWISMFDRPVEPIWEKLSKEMVKSREMMEQSHEKWKIEILKTLNSPLSKLEGMTLFVWGIGWSMFVWWAMTIWNQVPYMWLTLWLLLLISCVCVWLLLRMR